MSVYEGHNDQVTDLCINPNNQLQVGQLKIRDFISKLTASSHIFDNIILMFGSTMFVTM